MIVPYNSQSKAMKNLKPYLTILLAAVILTACQKKATEPIVTLKSSSLDLKALSAKVMERINLQPGEKVFMVGQPNEFDSLIVLLGDQISKSGGVYMGTINVDTVSWPSSWNNDFVKSTNGKTKEELTKLFDSLAIDIGIMLPGPTPANVPYAAWQDVLRKGKGRAVHFHWAGANSLTGSPIPIDSTISKIYQKVILETDYTALTKIQSEFENAIRKETVTITTPKSSLTFKIGDRPVTKQDGDISKARSEVARNLIDREVELPAGAIRVAPLEETIEGTIEFPNAMWGDQRVEGLVVTFKKGKITDIKAIEGLDLVKSKLEPGKEGYLFRELGVGFNPLLAVTNDNQRILHYGYGAGIVRLSFGNNAELGGVVAGDFVRINLFTDATVTVGKDVWIKDGKLMK